MEGSSLTILCTSNTASAELTDVFVNSRLSLTPSFAINGSEARFTVALVSRTDNGNVYTCADAADGSSAISDPLNVLCEFKIIYSVNQYSNIYFIYYYKVIVALHTSDYKLNREVIITKLTVCL